MTKDAVKTCRLAVTGVPKTVVVEVLKDLAGTNKHEENTTASQESVPQASIEADLRSLFSTECELLRHFWACFPTDSAEKRYKVRTQICQHCSLTSFFSETKTW
ncbi:hypothetical protein Pelo_3561 [Pelomyxa schiedti]|nr:hypothetical protein Pelo_3561 [Pelomyxa schiedti]